MLAGHARGTIEAAGSPRTAGAGAGWGTPSRSTIVPRCRTCGWVGGLAHRQHRRHAGVGALGPGEPLGAGPAGDGGRQRRARSSGQRSRSFCSGTAVGIEVEHLEQRGEELRLDGADRQLLAVGARYTS